MQKKVITSIVTLLLCLMVAIGAKAEEKRYDTDIGTQVPLDAEIGGYMEGAYGMHVSFSSKVSVIERTGQFLYWYKISNDGSILVLVDWELLGRASSGRYNFPKLILLLPGTSKEFWLKTEESPVAQEGRTYVFQKIPVPK